jgi:hypothetical protein
MWRVAASSRPDCPKRPTPSPINGLWDSPIAAVSSRRMAQIRIVRDLEAYVPSMAHDIERTVISPATALRRLRAGFAAAEPAIGVDLAECWAAPRQSPRQSSRHSGPMSGLRHSPVFDDPVRQKCSAKRSPRMRSPRRPRRRQRYSRFRQSSPLRSKLASERRLCGDIKLSNKSITKSLTQTSTSPTHQRPRAAMTPHNGRAAFAAGTAFHAPKRPLLSVSRRAKAVLRVRRAWSAEDRPGQWWAVGSL